MPQRIRFDTPRPRHSVLISAPLRQRGVFLLEALIAILVFAIGILGIVALGATAVSSQSDAQYRSEAARYADDILSAIWVNMDRGTTLPPGTEIDAGQRQAFIELSLLPFVHQTTTAGQCSFSGAAVTNPDVSGILTRLQSAQGLPGATPDRVQIAVENSVSVPDATGTPVPVRMSQVTITVCWQAPSDNAPRRHVLRSVVS